MFGVVKELRALIGRLDAGRQNFVFPIPYARNCLAIAAPLSVGKTTRDERRWGRTRRALILRKWRDSPSQAQAESPHSLPETLNVNWFSWGCRGLQCLY